MIGMSAAALETVSASYVLRVRAESWLGSTLLAESVPIGSAAEEVDASLAVPERVTLAVPRLDGGTSWAPDAIDHPLASYGQRLKVEVGVDVGKGQTEWLQRGWFLIGDTDPQDDTVNVQATGLLTFISEARFTSPFQPSGTFASTLRQLVEPAVTTEVTGLTDRAVPGSMAFDEDRLAAVGELLDAWPAEASVDADGVLQVRPQADGPSVLALTDGQGGTVIRAQGGTTRSGAASVVVARGQTADGTQVQGAAADNLPASALRLGGPFNPLPVPFFFFSPLLTTAAQCRAAAKTILARLRRNAARTLTARIVPHPGLQAGDVVTVTAEHLTGQKCVIDTLTLPYTPDRGAMTLGLRVVI